MLAGTRDEFSVVETTLHAGFGALLQHAVGGPLGKGLEKMGGGSSGGTLEKLGRAIGTKIGVKISGKALELLFKRVGGGVLSKGLDNLAQDAGVKDGFTQDGSSEGELSDEAIEAIAERVATDESLSAKLVLTDPELHEQWLVPEIARQLPMYYDHGELGVADVLAQRNSARQASRANATELFDPWASAAATLDSAARELLERRLLDSGVVARFLEACWDDEALQLGSVYVAAIEYVADAWISRGARTWAARATSLERRVAS